MPLCDDTLATCRACNAGEDHLCAERSSLTPRCVDGLCVACVSPGGVPAEAPECESATGPNTSPICDNNVCRPCLHHNECMSGVCAKDNSGSADGIPQGSCVPSSQILVVDQDLCTDTGPVFCTPQQAFGQLGPTQRYVVLRRSAFQTDFSNLTLDAPLLPMGQPVYVIGPLSDEPPELASTLPLCTVGGVAGQQGLTVGHGNVILEGLFVQGNTTGISCTGTGINLQILRSFFSGNGLAIAASGGCQLIVAETWIGSGPMHSGFQGLPGNTRGIEITGSDFQIENSVFVDDGDYTQDALGGIHVVSLSATNAQSTVVNTTFYEQHGLIKGAAYITTFLCDNPVSDRLVVLNSLFFGDQPLLVSPEEHYIDSTCGLHIDHVVSNDLTLTQNQSVPLQTNPALFVNAAGRDLRPVTGSDAAHKELTTGGTRSIIVSGNIISAPSFDMDEQPRGQSSGQSSGELAIGAFEPVVTSTP
jgi:hypothetical protein